MPRARRDGSGGWRSFHFSLRLHVFLLRAGGWMDLPIDCITSAAQRMRNDFSSIHIIRSFVWTSGAIFFSYSTVVGGSWNAECAPLRHCMSATRKTARARMLRCVFVCVIESLCLARVILISMRFPQTIIIILIKCGKSADSASSAAYSKWRSFSVDQSIIRSIDVLLLLLLYAKPFDRPIGLLLTDRKLAKMNCEQINWIRLFVARLDSSSIDQITLLHFVSIEQIETSHTTRLDIVVVMITMKLVTTTLWSFNERIDWFRIPCFFCSFYFTINKNRSRKKNNKKHRSGLIDSLLLSRINLVIQSLFRHTTQYVYIM